MFRTALVALLAATACPVVQAGAELVLSDGTVVAGVTVERKQELYLLTLATEDVVALPVGLVVELRLTGDDDPAPSGLRPGAPETLVGPPGGPDLPRTAQQLGVFGERRAPFRSGPIDPRWVPRSDWNDDPGRNEFNPARWYRAPIDPTWTPRSAYRQSGDVTEFNPVRWYRAPIRSTWWPRDGFAPPGEDR